MAWIYDIEECPRCGQKHQRLPFEPLKPLTGLPENQTHWGTCPTSGQPILLNRVLLKYHGTETVNFSGVEMPVTKITDAKKG